jgi:hypothetical protein
METKGLVMHIHQNPFYDETLAYYPHMVYPLIPPDMACRWASVFHWLWLGHMNIDNKGL